MIDAYRSVQSKLDDIKYIYELITKITHYLDIKPIMPPMVIPYYYGTVPEDNGISAFVMLEGGHFTIHTFSYRECYFADLLYADFFDSEKLSDLLQRELPSGKYTQKSFDRRFKSEISNELDGDHREDFGPHLLARVQLDHPISMETLFDLFESLPYDLNMLPIMRPYILKSSKKNPSYLSGMTLIAQSHIAVHHKYEDNILYIDMFSCSFTDFSKFMDVINDYMGTNVDFELIIRGSKHDYIKSDLERRVTRYGAWQGNILK
jgi:S-adenosylmethionine/arginine decarboxylase-like enzyme